MRAVTRAWIRKAEADLPRDWQAGQVNVYHLPAEVAYDFEKAW
jgi:hypothetical protein